VHLKQIIGHFVEYPVSSAEEFWDSLSPKKYLFGTNDKSIFRGQAKDEWKLEPSLLRPENQSLYSLLPLRLSPNESSNRIFAEVDLLRIFAHYCDSAGLRIPGDSEVFRTMYLNPQKVIDLFISQRRLWPSREYFEIMALAQHHGIPTRLLDWSHNSYVAAYFAASRALRESTDGRLAVWALNVAQSGSWKNVEIIKVPGSNNANVAAQSGLFTLLRQTYTRGGPFEGPQCIDDYMARCRRYDLARITLPTAQASKVMDLCEKYGITAAKLYPDFYGAAKATLDSIARWSRSEWTDGRDVTSQRQPAF
jgi:hypothetical protein